MITAICKYIYPQLLKQLGHLLTKIDLEFLVFKIAYVDVYFRSSN